MRNKIANVIDRLIFEQGRPLCKIPSLAHAQAQAGSIVWMDREKHPVS